MADDSSKDPFNRVTNPDGTPLRDKDNAAPQHKPNYSTRPAPNLAPPGMSGIRQPRQRDVEEPQPDKPKIQFRKPEQQKEKIQIRKPEPKKLDDKVQAGLALDGGRNENSHWVSGRIITMPGYTFHAKVYAEPSTYGIDDGKISKLQVKKDGHEVINYDRGWDVRPETAEQKEAMQRIRNGLDDMPERKPFKGFDPSKDRGHGMER